MDITLKSNGKNMTVEIQEAIDKCYLSGGGRIILDKGEFLSGGLRLRSNCTLYLKSGATLKGTRDIADYDILNNDSIEPVDEKHFTDILWSPAKTRKTHDHFRRAASSWNNALIRIFEAHNVSIIGEKGSVIDGCDPYDPVGEEHYRGPHGIAFHYSRDLKFRGYTLKNTGNWAHIGYFSQGVDMGEVTVLGGHDGVHLSSCDNILIEKSEFYTGDDCVAGFDNCFVTVRDCVMNSACSGMRFGGADVLVENCRFYGPAKYFFRGSLSLEDKIAGNPCPAEGRRNMLAVFTYYSDHTLTVRRTPKNVVIRNCVFENVDRFLHFDFTGKQTWQSNRPLTEISFENIKAKGIRLPLNAYGSAEEPITIKMKDCGISFSERTDCAIRGGNFALIVAEDLRLENVDGALVKGYGGEGDIRAEKVTGVSRLIDHTDDPFESKNI